MTHDWYGWRPQDFEALGWVILTVVIFALAFIMMAWDERKRK